MEPVAANRHEIGMRGIFRRFSIGMGVVLGLSTAAPAQWSIGHHQIHIAVLTLGRLARPRLADRPLRQGGGREP